MEGMFAMSSSMATARRVMEHEHACIYVDRYVTRPGKDVLGMALAWNT